MWVEMPRGSELSLCLCKLAKQTEIQAFDGQNGSLRLWNAKTVLLNQVRASNRRNLREGEFISDPGSRVYSPIL